MNDRLRISDHVVLRYLERVDGVDVKAVRRRIAMLARSASESTLPGATGVRFDGYRLVITNDVVVTVASTHPDKTAKRKR